LVRGEPVTIRQGRKENRKEKRDYILDHYSGFFLVFLYESKILIFIKNNLKYTKNILNVIVLSNGHLI